MCSPMEAGRKQNHFERSSVKSIAAFNSSGTSEFTDFIGMLSLHLSLFSDASSLREIHFLERIPFLNRFLCVSHTDIWAIFFYMKHRTQ